MTYFFASGNTFRVAPNESVDIRNELPVGNYIIKEDPFKNLYLEMIDSFDLPKKLYGNTTRYAARILNTYNDRSTSTGVMLSGEKGSGKTLLSKTVSIEAAKLGYPTIVINDAWCDDRFSRLMQDIVQPCVVLFDEFEKVYDQKEQESILTLFDGVFPTKKLFILTCNDKYRVNDHMRNRPGRIFYAIDFKGLEEKFIREYCEENLVNKTYISKICLFSNMFSEFNFDMLKALIEDMNRYDESPEEAIKILNTKPDAGRGNGKYFTAVLTPGINVESSIDEIKKMGIVTQRVHCNPMMIGFCIEVDMEEKEWYFEFSPGDIVDANIKEGKFTLRNREGDHLVLTKEESKTFDYMSYLV